MAFDESQKITILPTVETFQCGPNWWTNRQTNHCTTFSHATSDSTNMYNM